MVGVFAVVFFEDVADVEVVAFGGLVVVGAVLDGDVVVEGGYVGGFVGYVVLEVEDAVFMFWVDYDPSVFGIKAGAG